jgi:hypothetical protein
MRHHFVRSSAGLRDPNFKNVTLLLHGDGTNGAQNNTFLDSSASNNAITTTGNVAQGSFSPYGDRWSNYFDGTGDYLTVPDNVAFDFGAGNFTIELWVYIAGNSSLNNNSVREANVVASFPTTSQTLTNSWGLGILGSGTSTGTGIIFSNWQSGSNAFVSATVTVPQNSWNHIAVARSGTTTKLFLNGAEVGSGTLSLQTVDSGQAIAIGRLGYPGFIQELNGYISNVRVLKGTALYTGSYTIPTAPLTAITNTTLLTCQSNRFADSSSNNFSVTRTGDVSVQRFSPFGPDTLYRTDRIGGSAYFDGGEFLQVANRGLKLTAGFFTAECWVYISAYSGNFYALFDDWYWQGGHNGGWRVFIDSLGRIVMQASNGNWNNWGGTFITSSNSVIRGQWNHVAIVRGANDLINIYINGISTTTPVARKELNLNSGSAQSAWQSRIGINASDIVFGGVYLYPFTGTISDLRVINGKCLYTANFTPPTEPLTAIPETTFLGRFTNGSIVDNAMMSSLETVGNAQISASVKKYGTGSLYFNGTTNLATNGYIKARLGQSANLSSGDFTVECWFYGMNNSLTDTESSLFQQGEHDWRLMYRRLSGQLVLRYAVASVEQISTAGDLFSLNTWNHVAVCKSGTTTTLYLNGVSVGTTTASPANSTNFVYVGANLVGTSVYWPLNGYIDDFRLTKGVARYTSNFTPPTAPFPDF